MVTRKSDVLTSYVCSFFAGRGPAYSGPQRRDLYISPMHQLRERRGIGRCVHCMCVLCSGGRPSAPPLGVAYCLAKPRLALIQCQLWPALLQHLATWLILLQRLARGLSHICLLRLSRQCSWHSDIANQGISNGQFIDDTVEPSYLPGINSRFIMCIGIIKNKLAPYGTDGRLLLTANFKVTWHKN